MPCAPKRVSRKRCWFTTWATLESGVAGDSRIRDWPAVEWLFVRSTDKPSSPRFISAFGRDVDVPEGRIHYDPTTRRVTYEAVDRRTDGDGDAVIRLLSILDAAPEPLSGRQIKARRGSLTESKIETAIATGITCGWVHPSNGPK